MNDNTYNGWTNRATWLVNLWLDEAGGAGMDEIATDMLRNDDNEDTRQEAVEAVAEAIEAWVDEQYDQVPQGLMRDLLDVSGIDYDEIASAIVENAVVDQ